MGSCKTTMIRMYDAPKQRSGVQKRLAGEGYISTRNSPRARVGRGGGWGGWGGEEASKPRSTHLEIIVSTQMGGGNGRGSVRPPSGNCKWHWL